MHKRENRKNREESVMCVCVCPATPSLLKSATHSPALFQSPSLITPFIPAFPGFSICFSISSFLLHLCCSLKLEYNGSVCFQFSFPAFHFHHSLPHFSSLLLLIWCIYLPAPFAYFNLFSMTSFL